ncbi:competence protein ComEA helix-hairpin-helix repeat region [Alteribacillus persepolensis]|uniref:Competence protein ComEA helix-hairpin-helix repeat region n=1 Tax=Alteribacillus persepolensis TaxID=568899 RepID=A0A1G7Z6E2_9BACI|nr:helix-hairpin-helix domain-containing protein [Alteribacillus persepolensis]SDH04169.1 competence protein ComEA helix-hairpin-helix repeat region [Alteribacillus persepolensis]
MRLVRYTATILLLAVLLALETSLSFQADGFFHSDTKKTTTYDSYKQFAAFAEDHPTLDIHFLDVGQGDSTLIVAPTGESMLIDGGKPENGDDIVRYLETLGIDRLEWVVATHPDIDHIGGLIDVLESVDVEKVLDSGREHDTKTYRTYRNTIKKHDIDLFIAEEGERLNTDIADKLQVLNAYQESDVRNDSSIVLHMFYKDMSVLFAGDATILNEKEMVTKYNVNADILKVAHHGSLTSTGEKFVQEVHPEIAVITYDKDNTFGHPNASVVNRLRNIGAKTFTTEQSGHIQVSLYNHHIHVSKKPWEGQGRKFPTPVPRNVQSLEPSYDMDKPVNINKASKDDLTEIPYVSPVTAEFIVSYRKEHGPFRSKRELTRVNGVGKHTYKKIKKYITT